MYLHRLILHPVATIRKTNQSLIARYAEVLAAHHAGVQLQRLIATVVFEVEFVVAEDEYTVRVSARLGVPSLQLAEQPPPLLQSEKEGLATGLMVVIGDACAEYSDDMPIGCQLEKHNHGVGLSVEVVTKIEGALIVLVLEL